MRRKLFNLATAASLAACFVMVALWASDYHIDLSPTWREHLSPLQQQRAPLTQTRYAVALFPDRLEIEKFMPPGALRWPDDYRETRLPVGFSYYRSTFGGRVSRTGAVQGQLADRLTICMPLWFALLLASLLPLWWVARTLMARERVRRGLCTCCGYDLRGTPDRCPECGAKPHRPPHNPPMQRTATA